MSSQQRARELVRVYDHILEQQIVGRGCSLACRDESLWKQVEDRLKDTNALEMHCLGIDALREMEESLKATAASAPPGPYNRRVRARGGLRGLAKAFEVLEQAALNLYLGPWREEYRVIKMFSGTFTHFITPVLSMPQIEKLFGLLGYQPSPFRPEQLCLQPPKVSPASLEDLLRLSCAFFVARCECHLLLSALGKHVGDAQWELNVVRERQRGNSLQVAFENVKKKLDVSEPPMELFDREDVDLYGDEQLNGEQKEGLTGDDENPSSLIRAIHSNTTSPAGQIRSNGASYMSSPLESDTSFSAKRSKSKRSPGDLKYDKLDSQQIQGSGLGRGEPDVNHLCSCINGLQPIKHCFDCDTLHEVTCAFLGDCTMKGHKMEFADNLPEKMREVHETSPPSGIFRESATNNPTNSNTAMSSSDVGDDSKPANLHPISYHACCDLRVAKPDPRMLCHKCLVFHSHLCVEGKLCRASHNVSELGKCSCGKFCARKPLVLCRYCGREYCSGCWYRQPVTCICGQTFDQESSV